MILNFNRQEPRNATVNVSAFLHVEVTVTVPPVAVTISRTMYKPNPMLPGVDSLLIPVA